LSLLSQKVSYKLLNDRRLIQITIEHLLTVTDVLKRPLFQHAEVVAGSRGLARPIRWVHILETLDGGAFLNGEELILSTGIGFAANSETRLNYLGKLIQSKAAGLCIELGTYIPSIPLDMLDMANHSDFPLIVFHQPIHFVNITFDLHEHIVHRHLQAMRYLDAFARDVQRITLESQSFTKLMAHFQEAIHSQTFFLSTDESIHFVPTMNQSVQTEITEILRSALLKKDESPMLRGTITISNRKKILYQPVLAMGNLLAYLGFILYDHEPDEFLLLMLDYTVTATAQLMLRKMFAEERELDSHNRFIDDILADKPLREEEVLTILGIRKGQPYSYLAVTIEVKDHMKSQYEEASLTPFHDMLAIIRMVLSRISLRVIMRSKGTRLYLLLIQIGNRKDTTCVFRQAVIDLRRTCQQALGQHASLRLGTGRASHQFSEAKRHFREAEQVLALPFSLPCLFFEDLGVYRLLLQMNDGYTLESFISDYLGSLIEYDKKHGSQLLLTLRTVLDHNGSKQDAAEKLYIRRQSLYHRLDKIQELVGETYLMPAHRICLELALRAYEWIYQTDKDVFTEMNPS
jgi:PucR family transcriptional regulator, purine catabolism regulatory protein